MGWLAFGLASAMLAAGCQAAPPIERKVASAVSEDSAEVEAILSNTQDAIAKKDFARLEAMEQEFRSSRARTRSGTWKLAAYHGGLQYYLAEGLKAEEGCQYRQEPFVRAWQSAIPGSAAAAITDAELLLSQAWCIRGTGYASSVSEQAWPAFHAKVDDAADALRRSAGRASIDPEFYAVKLDVMRAQGAPIREFEAVFDQATRREPYYHRTYFHAAWNYLPQWGGSYEEVDRFARQAVKLTQRDEGAGLYARIFWSLDECGCDLIGSAANWAFMKESMRDVYEKYPDRSNGQYFADLSCRLGDGEEGRRYLRALHPEATGDGDLAAIFARCDQDAQNPG